MKLVAFDYPQYRYIGYNLKRDVLQDGQVPPARWLTPFPCRQIIE